MNADPALVLGPAELAMANGRAVLRVDLRIVDPIAFAPHLRLTMEGAQGTLAAASVDSHFMPWLPRGNYRVEAILPSGLGTGPARFRLEAWRQRAMRYEKVAGAEAQGDVRGLSGAPAATQWTIESQAPAPPLGALSWRKGQSDWFWRHFDHAAPTVISYMLADSPLLRGRILDVGCGDGITDLGIALRTGCEELVGIDPFRGYERLPQILAQNHLPPDALPPNLRFLPESANALPFADDSFDVVISWGSLEHIAGGYARALEEIRRVLRRDGLFFVHPGLYYSFFGHHLGEFSDEPHFHLKRTPQEVRRIVMETPPRYIDRSGEFSRPEQYWQWYTELNPITVASFERELRALDFEPWRVAIRTQDVIEYTPELQRYPMQDLATNELYVSCYNRKGAR